MSRGRSPSARAFIPIFPVSKLFYTLTSFSLVFSSLLARITNGEPLLKRSSSYSHSFPVCNDSGCCWSANGYSRALTYKASSNLLNANTYRYVCMGNHPSKQIELVVHYIILNFLYEESVSGESGGRVYL